MNAIMPISQPWRRWTALAAAALLLNSSLTFENIWPTPAIRWGTGLSIELTVCLLVMVLRARRLGEPPAAALRWLAGLWVLLVIGRYADVTAPSLYGRPINLYWDLRYIPDVVAMLARVAPAWLVLLAMAAGTLAFILLYVLLRWAFACVGQALARSTERRVIGAIAATAAVLFLGQHLTPWVPAEPRFSVPVTQTYTQQIGLVMKAFRHSNTLAPRPDIDSDLALVKGADVLLIFVESYGAVSYERSELADRLARSRARFEAAIRRTNRDVVSTYVESPTFGGSSWLAHISLISGVEVRDADENALLMTEKRETLVTTFTRGGYRAIALMPGLRQRWPEGAFYRFDDIYGAERLAYHGPQFGWWSIPDQFSLARLDELELARQPRAPLFAFFPTISTHTPFSPTPPYQPDWRRVLSDHPYDTNDWERSFDEPPDWLNLGPGYAGALSYDYDVLAGFVQAQADRDVVLIVVGDHQPPAAVSGKGASWDVPVHVIASRQRLLERLRAHGFRDGLTPRRPALTRMNALLPILLDAFGSRARTEEKREDQTRD